MYEPYKAPDFVVWADESIIEKCRNNVINKYGIDGFISRSIVCKDMPFDELRELATVVSEFGYDKEIYEKVEYKYQRWIKDELNAEFDRRISNILDIYNMLDRKHNKEKCGGEERYKLLALHNRKGYSEMSVLKNTVWVSKLIGKQVNFSVIEELNSAMTSTLYWEFGYENKNVKFDESKENFKICNDARIEEINAQNKFVEFVCNGDLDNAYQMIEKQIQNQF